MELELLPHLRGRKRTHWLALLARTGLEPDGDTQQTALVWDGNTLAATGSRKGNLLKCIAADPAYQGQGLIAMVLTALRQDAFQAGFRHLFLYTKPENEAMFASLFFYPIVRSEQVLLMESEKSGIRDFLAALPKTGAVPPVGAAVMNCDPFTLGHRHLIETASRECGQVYVFVLSEDGGRFSPADRLEMVRRGTADLGNVTVLPTGPYLISAATFPTYFLKDRETASQAHCLLDIAVFLGYFVPHFSITRRYVGTEPHSPLTARYNDHLLACLPPAGVEVRLVPRLTHQGGIISASTVRRCLDCGDTAAICDLVPQTTFDYLCKEETP